MGTTARTVAFRIIPVLLVGTTVGSLLPETGNVATDLLGLPGEQCHIFNPLFLVIGITGVVLALCLRRGKRI